MPEIDKTDKTGKTDGSDTGSDNGAPVLAEIVTAIRELYRKYVAFHSDHAQAQSGTMALYTLYTHVYDDFEFAPIVLVTAPTSEAGKSRLFDTAELVVRNPEIVVDPSGPSIRNLIDATHPTLMVDEADLLTQNKDMKVIFNAGVEKGRKITRAAGRNGIVSYDPFGTKMLAGIYGENPPLKGATLSRCIQIGLRRRHDTAREDIADFNKTDARAETAILKAYITRWAMRVNHDDLSNARPDMPGELTDRQRDAWLPLVVVADLVDASTPGDTPSPGPWGQAARNWAVELSQAVPVTPDVMVQVLRDAYKVMTSPEHATDRRIKSTVLASERNAMTDREYDDDLSPIQLSKRLARFGIKPVKWYEDKSQVRGFTVRGDGGQWTAQWLDAIGRYRLDEARDNDAG